MLFQYLIKLSISLAVVYLFYHFLLRRLTFYNANRWYLLLYSFASFLMPFINITTVVKDENFEAFPITEYIPAVAAGIPVASSRLPQIVSYQGLRLVGQYVIALLVIGMAVMAARLIIQYISYLKIKRSSKLLFNERVRIFQVDSDIIPFSIGNAIFINEHLHSEEELKKIIHHEFIHVKQNHTLDIFLGELLCVLNWYNPFAWMIRRAIKANLEFIADSKVLESGLDRKEYQRLLLKVIGISKFSITTQFNFSSLKKRIAMMNKKQSAKSQLLKLLLLLPVFAIVLLAFRDTRNNISDTKKFQQQSVYLDTIPTPPSAPAAPTAIKNPLGEFLRRNPTVKDVYVKNDNLVVELKSGKKETYNVEDKTAYAAAEKKYGKIPLPPPPPPPPPPPSRPALPKEVKSITITEEKAVVVLSNGKSEEYDLTKPEEHMEFDRKYRQPDPVIEEEMRKHQAEKMELALKLDYLDRIREDQLNNKKELNDLQERRGEDMERRSKVREEEFQLLQEKLQRDLEQNEVLRRREFENAMKQKGADVDRLQREYELKQQGDIMRRDMRLRLAEKELESKLMSEDLERNRNIQRSDEKLQREREELMELKQEKEAIEKNPELGSKNLSKEQKQKVLLELQQQKTELNKMAEDLKAKQIQLNKQIQDLQKSEKKKA
jgi:beta-lactamase regulating signal transducer with metallopeptidase domain